MSEREHGFYWVRYVDNRRAPTIAYWDGDWSFIGTLYLLDDDEMKSEGITVVEKIAPLA